jgi:hypothetical protein
MGDVTKGGRRALSFQADFISSSPFLYEEQSEPHGYTTSYQNTRSTTSSSCSRAQSFESPRFAFDIPLNPFGLSSLEEMTQIPLQATKGAFDQHRSCAKSGRVGGGWPYLLSGMVYAEPEVEDEGSVQAATKALVTCPMSANPFGEVKR